MQVSSTTSTQSNTSTQRKTGSTLGKDDFLRLLVTQMQNQDPLNPTEDTEFIAQMAQFTSLEQMQNLVKITQFQQASTMIDKNVKAEVTEDGYTQLVYGRVTSAREIGGEMYLTLNNGVQIKADEVLAVLSGDGLWQEAVSYTGEKVYVRQYNSGGYTESVKLVTIKEVKYENGQINLYTTDGEKYGLEDIWNIAAS
ncbi:MAG TPA: flagellar hook capping FlgD N-terminal domain-containing protein [Bacillota bacterium]|nr:flagellar hook capping FlgD N-terminal domain-containing protein [Bacillota bacterium]